MENKKVECSVETITPIIAAEMLKNKNPNNRKSNATSFGKYKRDMASNNWQLNGETICVDWNGILMNGHHRLHSCVAANTPFQTVVVKNLDPKCVKTIDSGKKRSFADQLTMDGVKHASNISAAIIFLDQLAHQSIKKSGLTNTEMYAIYNNHPKIADSILRCKNAFSPATSWLPAVHYIGCILGEEADAEAFVEVYAHGQKTYENDAAHYAREWLLKDASRKVGKSDIDFRKKLFIKSWNLFATKKPLTRLRIEPNFELNGFTKEILNGSYA
tara:strand:- start:905 stop:1723 length:819 start_codon:yes stop_codon:yes gene_type:complete